MDELIKEFPHTTIQQMRVAIQKQEPFRPKTLEERKGWLVCINDDPKEHQYYWCPDRDNKIKPCERHCSICGRHVFKYDGGYTKFSKYEGGGGRSYISYECRQKHEKKRAIMNKRSGYKTKDEYEHKTCRQKQRIITCSQCHEYIRLDKSFKVSVEVDSEHIFNIHLCENCKRINYN